LIRLSDLFEIQHGTDLELNRLIETEVGAGFPFVGRSKENNGITAWVQPPDDIDPIPGGILTVALGGSVLSTFYQEHPFYTGFHIACLIPKVRLSPIQMQYYALHIGANKFRYNFARQANRTLKDLGVPDIKALPKWLAKVDSIKIEDKVNLLAFGKPSIAIDTSQWANFELQMLFDIKKGERLTKKEMDAGKIPFIGATDSNNGLTSYIGQAPIHDGNTISVNYNGSVGEAFYQPTSFWASDDVNVLYPKFDMSPTVGLFLATIIRHIGKTKFSYVRKWNLERMASTVIKLPQTKQGTPDWKSIKRMAMLACKNAGLQPDF
jgi:hypothetical protein